jgi:transposase
MNRKSYPSDINREQFELIRLELEGLKKKTAPRKVDLYDIFCAILYILKSGCQWRMLPSDYPHWRTVYGYFKEWGSRFESEDGKLEKSFLEFFLKKSSKQDKTTE